MKSNMKKGNKVTKTMKLRTDWRKRETTEWIKQERMKVGDKTNNKQKELYKVGNKNEQCKNEYWQKEGRKTAEESNLSYMKQCINTNIIAE